MKVGKCRTIVEFQEYSLTQNASTGEADRTWTTYAARFADVRAIRGSERIEYNKINATVSHRIYVRADPNFYPKPTHRCLLPLSGKTIYLSSVIDIEERGAWYECMGYEELDNVIE